jgi:alkaline phosphatase D
VIPDQKGMDEWGNFPLERRRLLDFVEKTGNAIILSGNVHFADISRLGGESGLVDFTSSGMTHVNESYGAVPNRHRVGKPLIELNFGLVEIDWEASEVVLSACGVDGEFGIKQCVPFAIAGARRAAGKP